MIGTIVNTLCIIGGCIIGATLKKGIKPQYQTGLYNAMGLCALVIGINACVCNMPKSDYPVLFIICMALGALIGFWSNLAGRFDKLVNRFSSSSQNNLGQGLSTAILLFCVGPLSMIGPVMSALQGDNTYLFTNATLDIVSSAILASTFGIGIIWSAPILFCWQGAFYIVSKISASAISHEFMTEISIVGGILIISSGLSILGIKDCKTLNLLPALLIPILFFLGKALLEMM